MPEHLLDRLGDRLKGFRGSLQAEQPLAPIVWFRAGGPAEILAMPADPEDLAFLMRALPEDIPVTVFGLGSNLYAPGMDAEEVNRRGREAVAAYRVLDI